MSTNPPLPGRGKPGTGYVKKQPPKTLKSVEVKTTPFGLEPIEDDGFVMTDDEQDEYDALVQSGGGLEGLQKAGQYMEALKRQRRESGSFSPQSGSSSRVSGEVMDIDPSVRPERSNTLVIEKKVKVLDPHYHFINKLSGIGASFLLGAISTLIMGAFTFNYLLSEGYIRQYFY